MGFGLRGFRWLLTYFLKVQESSSRNQDIGMADISSGRNLVEHPVFKSSQPAGAICSAISSLAKHWPKRDFKQDARCSRDPEKPAQTRREAEYEIRVEREECWQTGELLRCGWPVARIKVGWKGAFSTGANREAFIIRIGLAGHSTRETKYSLPN